MKKPDGYDEAQASGEFTPVELGGHYAVVKQVSETQSSTGKDMIVVLFDFMDPDKQSGYFQKIFNDDTRDPRKWPFNGSRYILVADYNDPKKTSRNFKTFCTCIEKSNDYTIQWGGKNWAQQFKGKKIGVVYGEEEHEYEGRVSMRHVPKWFCRWDAVKEAQTPAPKYLNGSGPARPTSSAPTTDENGFMSVPEGADDDIPF